MEDSTPVTQSLSGDSPIQDSLSKSSVSKDSVSTPARPKGPNASAIVLGLVAMAFAALIIAIETAGLAVDWSRLGPGAIVGIGLLLVVLGALGLRRRHNDA
jgi:hypothetical protein